MRDSAFGNIASIPDEVFFNQRPERFQKVNNSTMTFGFWGQLLAAKTHRSLRAASPLCLNVMNSRDDVPTLWLLNSGEAGEEVTIYFIHN
jgi:hypothetical protein